MGEKDGVHLHKVGIVVGSQTEQEAMVAQAQQEAVVTVDGLHLQNPGLNMGLMRINLVLVGLGLVVIAAPE